MPHQPVLLDEVIQHLAIAADGIYIDGTFGRGGHSTEILRHLGPQGHLFAMDKDADAIAATQQAPFVDPRFSIARGSFIGLRAQMEQRGWLGKVNGILLDLGVSSPQLDDVDRGFSFLRDGPLDMRMDSAQTLDAKQWLNSATEQEISTVLREYGDERYAVRIAKAIVAARSQLPLTTTGQLAAIVSKAHPRWERHKHPATRTFQAVRIFINRELIELREVLIQSLDILAVGGRLLVISFHSLEDRIVKEFIKTYSTTEHWPRELPVTHATMQASLRLKRINGAIRPGERELAQNIRARSATLRIMEKIK